MQTLKVADIGSSAVSSLELQVKGPVILEIYPSDKENDMENLSYNDNSFDIVHCRNALDHTANAPRAVLEMMRICKPGGQVYIKCWLDQKEHKGHHYWSAKEDGILTNGRVSFDLKDFGFKIRYTDNGGPRRYNYIEATLEKK